jgi:hypothetical protein
MSLRVLSHAAPLQELMLLSGLSGVGRWSTGVHTVWNSLALIRRQLLGAMAPRASLSASATLMLGDWPRIKAIDTRTAGLGNLGNSIQTTPGAHIALWCSGMQMPASKSDCRDH